MTSLDFSPQAHSDIRVGLGRVLIVEDEELIRETVALGLAEEGFDIFNCRRRHQRPGYVGRYRRFKPHHSP